MHKGQHSRAEITRTDGFIADVMARHGPAVLRLAYVQTGGRADAQDVYQDVFLRLATDATQFHDDDHLRAWLLRVTVNRCRGLARSAAWRRQVPLEAVSFAGDACTADDLESASLERIEATRLWETVRRLKPKYREVIHLRYEEDMSCEQMAKVLDVRPSTVRTRLQRAHEQLRRMMGGIER